LQCVLWFVLVWLQCGCNVLQCVAECCSVLQRVAACCIRVRCRSALFTKSVFCVAVR